MFSMCGRGGVDAATGTLPSTVGTGHIIQTFPYQMGMRKEAAIRE
jgi:hypothetical protein